VLLVDGRPGEARPEPALPGAFTTLRAVGGVPLFWRDHAERLADGARAVGLPPPDLDAIRDEISRASAGLFDARVRVTLLPSARLVEARPRTAPPAPLVLRPVEAPPPDAARTRKLLPRAAYDALARRLGGADDAILREGGEYLECTRSNLFVVAGRRLATPAADGRILPGVARRHLLAIAEALGFEGTEAPILARDLATAEACVVTNAVLLAAPVGSVEGVATFRPHPVAARIEAALLARAREGV
jgi:branched-subunit amino acid aminotransferase/4-amino-4-deoxychorismate lyase